MKENELEEILEMSDDYKRSEKLNRLFLRRVKVVDENGAVTYVPFIPKEKRTEIIKSQAKRVAEKYLIDLTIDMFGMKSYGKYIVKETFDEVCVIVRKMFDNLPTTDTLKDIEGTYEYIKF